MDTKSKMQEVVRHLNGIARGRELNVMESDARDAAQAYLTQCEEIDAYKTKNIINGELRIYYRNQAFEEAAELAEDYYEADNLIQLQVEIAKAIRARINHE